MKKKIISLCLVVALGATAVIGGTLAYFTDADEAENTFTVGNVSIDLTEPNWDSEGLEDAPEVYPGEALAKDPTVTNDGKNPCFVRVKVTGLDALIDAELSEEEISLRGVSANWTKIGDYYYYNGVLEVGKSTDALFTHIVMPTDLVNGDATTGYDVDVFAEAVQAQGARPSWDKPDVNDPLYPGVLQMNVEQIAAWFATCMPVETPAQ